MKLICLCISMLFAVCCNAQQSGQPSMPSNEVTFKTLKTQILDQKETRIFDGYKEGVVRFTTESGDLKNSKTLLIINGIYKAVLQNPDSVMWKGDDKAATLTVFYKDAATADNISIVIHYAKNPTEELLFAKPVYITVIIEGAAKTKRTFTLSEFV